MSTSGCTWPHTAQMPAAERVCNAPLLIFGSSGSCCTCLPPDVGSPAFSEQAVDRLFLPVEHVLDRLANAVLTRGMVAIQVLVGEPIQGGDEQRAVAQPLAQQAGHLAILHHFGFVPDVIDLAHV